MVRIRKRNKQEEVLSTANIGKIITGTVSDPAIVMQVLRHRAFPDFVKIRRWCVERTLPPIKLDRIGGSCSRASAHSVRRPSRRRSHR